MFFLLIAVALATKCTYDATKSSSAYGSIENYHERYCDHPCPCDGLEGCEMDFTDAPVREMEDVKGKVETLTTRLYDLTFAVNVPVNATYEIGTTQIKAGRMHYKLGEGSTLIVGTQKTNATGAKLTTIVRCNKQCTVKDSEFPKEIDDSISFMPEKTGEDSFVDSELLLENVKFYAQSGSTHFNKNYARDQLKVTMKNVKFVIEEDLTNVDVVGLFYTTGLVEGSLAEISLEIKQEGAAKYNVTTQCDGKWIVALKEGSDKVWNCEDPTVALGDKKLEENCETAFIVIVCIFDVALVVIIAIFLVLILVPIIKKKAGKKYQEI